MNLSSVESTSPARSPVAAQARPAGGFDVTISDRGVAVDGAQVPAAGPGQGEAARPAVEARLMNAIAAPRAGAPTAPAAAPARSLAAGETGEPASAPASAVGRVLGMYTGRGRAATMPREGLAGQLIDVTG